MIKYTVGIISILRRLSTVFVLEGKNKKNSLLTVKDGSPMTNNDENMPPETTALPLKPYSRQVGMESVQYKHLRSRLDKLGYLDSFSPDSLALVHRMLEDLVQTTDSCRRLKTEMDRSSQIRQRLETEVSEY